MKIVRKVQRNQVVTAFWLDHDEVIRGTWEGELTNTVAEEVRAIGAGWMADERDAELVGTTLAALRAELTETEEGDDGK